MMRAAPKPAISLLLTILLLNFLEFLQSGMIAFAASPIMGEIGAAPEEFSLATCCYACVAIATISKQRWLVERLGWRRFVLGSLALFVLGCLICAASDAFLPFLIGRAVMGLGGASFMTSGRVIVNLIPPSPKRFVGIRFFATGLAAGIAFAPWLAAWAISGDDFSAIFFVLIGVALLAGVCAAVSLPADLVPRELRSQSHPVLFMTLVSASFMLLYTLQRSQYDFFSDALLLLSGASGALFGIYYFVRGLRRHERPLFDFKALQHPRYLYGVGLFSLCNLLLGANNSMLPVLLQKTLGFAWQTVGEFQSLGLSSALLVWLIMGWMLPRWPGSKKFYVVGFGALGYFGWHLAGLNGNAELWSDILPALLCHGVFIMVVMATTASKSFLEVQHHEAVMSNAQQLKNMAAQFSMALGVAGATLFTQWRSALHYDVLGERFVTGGGAYVDSLQRLATGLAPAGENSASAQLGLQLAQQATLLACTDYFSIIAILGVLGVAIMLRQRVMH